MKNIEICIVFIIPIITFILSIYVYYTPLKYSIENYLSIYPMPRVFPWYPFWRMALVFFLAWIIVLFFYLLDILFLKYDLLVLGIFFSILHYLSIINYNVRIYPLFFLVIHKYGGDLHVDLGQIILILSTLPFISSRFKKRVKKKRDEKS